jgi:hypothetical protein
MSDYASVSELKADINLRDAGEAWTATLQRALNAAERVINRTCNRPEGFVADSSASARYYCGSGGPIQWIDECAAVSSVAVKDSPSDDEDSYASWTLGTVGTTTDADCFPATGSPDDPDFHATPYTFLVIGANGSYSHFTSGKFTSRGGFPPAAVSRGTATVKVMAQWGYALTVPDDIKEAAIMQAARWFQQLKSGKADTLASSEFGMLLYRQKLDPDVEQILVGGRYIKPAIGRR